MPTIVWLVPLVWTLVCLGAVGYGWFRHAQLQRALQWWWKRQVTQAYENAENLRNYVLQESFALRRHLELIGVPEPSGSTIKLWQAHMPLLLESANRLHREVQGLSDQLSSPFLEDSLLLAIRHVIAAWEKEYPKVNFSLNLPAQWEPENEIQQDILTKVLDECLHLCLTDLFLSEIVLSKIENDSERCDVAIALHSRKNWHYLTIQMTFPTGFTASIYQRRRSFHYLGKVFQTLMPGHYTLKLAPQTLSFMGQWKSL